MKSLSRREFSRLITAAAAAMAVAPLGLLNARRALAQSCSLASFAVPGFGVPGSGVQGSALGVRRSNREDETQS